MSATLEQMIIEKVQALAPEQQKRVLEFLEQIRESSKRRKSMGEIVEECFKDVPREAFERLPTDASENFDHYLYGAPKK